MHICFLLIWTQCYQLVLPLPPSFGVGGETPGWHKPQKGLADSPLDFPVTKRTLLGCFPVVIRLGVPMFFVVRATHLQGNIQVKEAAGLGQAPIP